MYVIFIVMYLDKIGYIFKNRNKIHIHAGICFESFIRFYKINKYISLNIIRITSM
jgi:hypothetical protein